MFLKKIKFTALITFLFYFSVSFFIFFIWAQTTYSSRIPGEPGFNEYSRAELSDQFQGLADIPFAYRSLVPDLARSISILVPSDFKNFLSEKYPKLSYLSETINLSDKSFYFEAFVVLFLIFLSLIIYCYQIRRLFLNNYESGSLTANLAPLVSLLFLPLVFYQGTRFPYDFPQLALFTLALNLIIEKKKIYFFTVFIICCFNKETAILLSFIYLCNFALEQKRLITFIEISAQILLALAIRQILELRFSENQGANLEDHLYYNLEQIFSANYLFSPGIMLLIGTLLLLVFRKFAQRPAFLKMSLLIFIPLAMGKLHSGIWGETRVFLEVYPIVFLLAYQSLVEFFAYQIKVKKNVLTYPESNTFPWLEKNFAIICYSLSAITFTIVLLYCFNIFARPISAATRTILSLENLQNATTDNPICISALGANIDLGSVKYYDNLQVAISNSTKFKLVFYNLNRQVLKLSINKPDIFNVRILDLTKHRGYDQISIIPYGNPEYCILAFKLT